MNKFTETFKFALIKSSPIMLSYFFVAAAFGIVMQQGGWNWIWSAAASTFIYTGAFQFVLASFLSTGASVATICLTAAFMNIRQVFYGISYVDDFKKTGKWEPYMIHSLTDETYALYSSVNEYPANVDKPKAQRYIALLAQSSWILGSIAGALFGNLIPSNMQGIDFALTALFITIVIDQWKSTENHIPALTGLFFSVLFLIILGADKFLLPSLILTSGLMFLGAAREDKDEQK